MQRTSSLYLNCSNLLSLEQAQYLPWRKWQEEGWNEPEISLWFSTVSLPLPTISRYLYQNCHSNTPQKITLNYILSWAEPATEGLTHLQHAVRSRPVCDWLRAGHVVWLKACDWLRADHVIYLTACDCTIPAPSTHSRAPLVLERTVVGQDSATESSLNRRADHLEVGRC